MSEQDHAAMEKAAEAVLRRELGRRDLPWADKTQEEQIEILRQEVRNLRMGIEQAVRQAGDTSARHFQLVEDFACHRHDGVDVVKTVQRSVPGGPMGMVSGMGSLAQRNDPLR